MSARASERADRHLGHQRRVLSSSRDPLRLTFFVFTDILRRGTGSPFPLRP